MVDQFKTFGHQRGCILGDQNLNQMGIRTNPMYSQPASQSAFGEALVAQLTPYFQQSFEYTVDNTHLTDNTVVASGTVTQASGMAVCATTATTGSTAQLSSGHHGKYQAGQGGLARFTALFTTGVAATEQLMGMADTRGSSVAFKNGYMVGFIGASFGVHRFRNDTVTTIDLADCDDPLDGTGESGMTYDPTKLNVFEIRFQYLGAGAIEYYIESDTTGRFVRFHKEDYANSNTQPSVHNPNFHINMFVNNKATTTELTVKTASFALFVEGKSSHTDIHQPQFSSGLKEKTVVTSEQAIFTIRNKTSYAGKTNFIDIKLEQVVAQIEASAANNLGYIRVLKDATFDGTTSYTDISTSNSVIDIDVGGTTVTAGEELLVLPLAGKNSDKIIDVTPFDIIIQHGESVTFAGVSVNSATVNAQALWKELF